MRFRRSNLVDILAARREEMQKGKEVGISRKKEEEEGVVGELLRREVLGGDEKLELLDDLQSKFRIKFTARFPMSNITWKIITQKTMLQKCYDPSKRSYYFLKGKIEINHNIFNSKDSAEQIKQNESLQGERGLGMVFGEDAFERCRIYVEGAVILVLEHGDNSLQAIERDILMTNREKRRALKRFKIFQEVQNFQKYFFSYIQPVKYAKGEFIYQKGELSTAMYLIIEGEVSLQMSIEQKPAEVRPTTNNLADLIRKKRREDICFTTEIMNEGCYFGQEEVLHNDLRRQNAKCKSIHCVLLIIPANKVNQLMQQPNFRDSLQASSQQRFNQRKNKLQIFTKVKMGSIKEEINASQEQQRFQKFKYKIYRSISEDKDATNKISLQKSKKKVVHGHVVKLNSLDSSPERNQEFSMLQVDQKTYDATRKRFRQSLMQIQIDRTPKKRTKIKKGRSLHQVWNSLNLETVFNINGLETTIAPAAKVYHQNCNGKQSYDTCTRILKKQQNQYRQPKAFSANYKTKREYLSYLHSISQID